jgi:hypothetical protein
MISKYSHYSQATLPQTTGRTWEEWVAVLDAGIPRKCGITPVMQYLIDEYRLKPTVARKIAIQYVLS